MNSLDDIRRKLETMEKDQAASKVTLTEIHVALIGKPLDPKAPPGMVEVVEQHGYRLASIEKKHRTVVRWVAGAIGAVTVGALGTVGTMIAEAVRSGRGGH